MKNWKRYIPEGTRDLLFEDCSKKNNIVNTLRDFYLKSGFLEAATPTLEFYDVFRSENLSIEQEKMYKLFDNNGRILVLRPDMTTPIARVAATKLKSAAYPIRICYSGNVFRMNEAWGGKYSEITQSGIEIIGSESKASDSDVIITAIKALLNVGLEDFEIEVGQADFFKALIEDIKLEEEEIERLRSLVENKNYIALREFVKENEKSLGASAEALKSLPELFGEIDVLDRAKNLTDNIKALKALENIEEIYKNIEAIGLSKFISIDLGMVQHIHYYTGITFRGYSSIVGVDVLSGGRYNKLISQFGEDIEATGFGINIDNVLAALNSKEVQEEYKEKYLVFYEDNFINTAYLTAEDIREKGFSAEISLLKTSEESLSYGRNKKLSKMIVILDNERLNLIDINSGQSIALKIGDFLKSLGG